MMKTAMWMRFGGTLLGFVAAAIAATADDLSVDEWSTRARMRLLAGDREGAASAYRNVLELNSDDREAAAFLAELERQGNGARWQVRAELLADVGDAWRCPEAHIGVDTPATDDPVAAAVLQRLDAIRLCQLEFAGAKLSSVLATLSSLAAENGAEGGALNLVLIDPSRMDPEVTLSVRDVSLRRALDFVTESVGFVYEARADAVVVRAEGGRAPLETVVLPLSPAVATRMANAVGGAPAEGAVGGEAGGGTPVVASDRLRMFFEQAGVHFAGVEGSSLIFDGSAVLVTQTARNLARIRAILDRYNSVRQVEIEAKFLEVEDGVLEELGINWSAARRHDPVTGVARERYLTGNRSVADAFSGSASNGAISIDGQTVANVTAPVLPGVVPLAAGAKPLAEISGFIGEFDVGATVRALAQKQGSDLLSAPKVTVLSGHSASITVARQLRYPRQYGQIQSQVGQAGGGENSSSAGVTITAGTPQDFATENVGVELQVTPIVEEDARRITLDLHPVVTEFEGFVEFGGPSLAVSGGKTVTIPSGFYQPIFSRRSVSTRVTLWDGATLVMGGLTREETRKVNDKVPVLGDLPAIGRLFRSSGEGATKRNLLIFVTASLVGPGGGWARVAPVPQPRPTVQPEGAPPNAP